MTRRDLARAATALSRGGLIAYPTESCYGLGCDPRNHAAIRRLLRLKRRPWQSGLILIADHPRRLRPYIAPLTRTVEKRLAQAWPGPHTFILPATTAVSRWLRGIHEGIAVRVTAHPAAAALCRHFRGPLVSTSANRHGLQPVRQGAGIGREFGAAVDYVLYGRIGAATRPTEIRDGLSGRVLRAG